MLQAVLQSNRGHLKLTSQQAAFCTCRWVLHIVDTNPNSLSARGWLEDTSKVQKFTMSDADYKARENTYWKYKQEKLKVLTCPRSAAK